jgi:hypothetical protein
MSRLLSITRGIRRRRLSLLGGSLFPFANKVGQKRVRWGRVLFAWVGWTLGASLGICAIHFGVLQRPFSDWQDVLFEVIICGTMMWFSFIVFCRGVPVDRLPLWEGQKTPEDPFQKTGPHTYSLAIPKPYVIALIAFIVVMAAVLIISWWWLKNYWPPTHFLPVPQKLKDNKAIAENYVIRSTHAVKCTSSPNRNLSRSQTSPRS